MTKLKDEVKAKYLASGKKYRFSYNGDKEASGYPSRFKRADGIIVTIVRPLYEEEADEPEISSLYLVKIPNGGRIAVFEDELVPA